MKVMMSLPASGSEISSFDRLHPTIRKWIRDNGWTELRDVQARAIDALLGSTTDLVISAATAAGKTEAAFLPILTHVATKQRPGLSVLYISPLKALINDQFRRLDELCERMEISVVRWHGDAPYSAKARLLRRPEGIALITPESIEALLVRRPGEAAKLFRSLSFVVIDELHAFLQGPRGLHLASLLKRIDALVATAPRRVGLSATIGDLRLAASWLRPPNGNTVSIIESRGDSPELRLQIRGYVEPPDQTGPDDVEAEIPTGPRPSLDVIADHLFKTLRGANNLVFAGSRRTVEAVADRLRSRSEREKVPNEFFPHHGSLSKDLRQELEKRLKDGNLPTTAVATTTLELGIDLGSVKSVAQIGAPRAVASLRQRLGRSGRRAGMPAIMRIYVREDYAAPDADPLDLLRLGIVRSVAAIRLLLAKFVEPAAIDTSIATALLHQTLSVIAQRGGAKASQIYDLLCKDGPLSLFTSRNFADLLRNMASSENELLEQAPDGTLMLGRVGEAVVSSREFFALFQSDEEWRLTAAGVTLGTIPLVNAVGVGSLVVFAGQRWRVTAVDDFARVLQVIPHRSGRIPKFQRLAYEPLHDDFVAEMRRVYLDNDVPSYLDTQGADLLVAGRKTFRAFNLVSQRFVAHGSNLHALTWQGTATNSLLAIALLSVGVEGEVHDLGLTLPHCSIGRAREAFKRVVKSPPPAGDLANFVRNLRTAKYDDKISEEILRRLWSRHHEIAIARLATVAAQFLDPQNIEAGSRDATAAG